MKLVAIDRFIRTDMHVSGIRCQTPVFLNRYIPEMHTGRRGSNIDVAVFSRFIQRFSRPDPCMNKIDRRINTLATQEVHGNDRIHGSGTALHEKNMVSVRNLEQFPEIVPCLFQDRFEWRTAVTHFHHRQSCSLPVQHFSRSLFQHLFRQHGRPC